MFTKGLAQMLLPSRGIRCNGVAPGPIWQVLLAHTHVMPPTLTRYLTVWKLFTSPKSKRS